MTAVISKKITGYRVKTRAEDVCKVNPYCHLFSQVQYPGEAGVM